ncbi:endolytic transglycosylase MltG [Paenibacillus sp. P26]|nr:endolytic transglycosylase MltG [Paenibacillus sp. P26]
MKRWAIWTLVWLGIASAGAVTGFLLYIGNALQPMPSSDEVKRVGYPPGTSIIALSAELEKQGLIRSGRAFTWYLKWKKQGGKFQAGEYEMNPGITPGQIIEKLNLGQTVKEDTLAADGA